MAMTPEQVEAKITQLEAALAAAKADTEAAKTDAKRVGEQTAAGQLLLDRWKSEVGSMRTLADELKALKDNKTISTATTTTGGGNDKEHQEAEAKKLQDELDQRQSDLTEEQGKRLDVAYAELTAKAEAGDAEAAALVKRIHEDLLFRKEFLSAVVDGSTLPASWRKSPAKSGAGQPSLADTVKKLFESQKKSSSYMPPGSSGGANTGSRGAPKKVQVEVSADSWSNKFFPGRFKVAAGS